MLSRDSNVLCFIVRLVFLSWAGVALSASAQVWQFDVDAADAAASETQTGYTRMTTPTMTGNSTNGTFSPTATLNGVTVTATASGGFRDRGTGGSLTNQALAALLRDFIFKDGAGGAISITINGLAAGWYDVRSFHFDTIQGPLTDNAFDLEVQDARATQTYPGLVWSVGGNNYRVFSDGTAPILITVHEGGAGNRVRFNGLRIVRWYGFDVDAFDAPAEETQTNFVRMSVAGMTGNSINGSFSPTATSGSVTITASASGGFRDRGNVGALGTDPLASALRDFIFEDGAGAAIDVSITGLPAGTYDIRSLHYDGIFTPADHAFNLVLQDADGTRTLSNQVWSVSGTRYSMRSSGSAALLITVIENNANDRARFNGLEIGGGEALINTPIPPAQAGDQVSGNMIMINDNGGWCWYQDERLIYDPVAGSIIASTAANYLGYGGKPRDTDIDAVTLQLAKGKRTRVTMGKRDSQGDDHDMGSLWMRPDGRYLHMYTGHNDATRNSFYHLSTNPHDPSAWGAELYYNWYAIGNPDTSGNITYNNLHYLTGEGTGQGRLYNFGRESQRSPNIAYSDDLGQTWHYGGKLTLTRTASSYSNGYLKYTDNGLNRVDFITTEHHPRDYNTSIYHGYIQGGKSYNSFGVLIDSNIFDEIAPAPEDFTPVFLSSAEDGVNDYQEYHRAWTTELERDLQGNLYALFTTRYGTNISSDRSGDADHRLFYAGFDGSQWRTTELCHVGRPLYFAEQDYTGLGAINPNNPSVVYVSTTFDPRNNAPLNKHEIFKGLTADLGVTWQWTQVTSNSTVDNLRPAIPNYNSNWDSNNTVVCWLRGDYVSQHDFDETLVAMVERRDQGSGPITFFDATLANTTLTNGLYFVPTGPATNNGAADNQWHQNSRFGNGGYALTANDGGTEDAPTLKTSITGLQEGTYDVFAFFWSRPGEDWRLMAGLSASEMLVFRRYSSQQAQTNQFDSAVNVLTQDVALYRAYVGRTAITNGGTLSVYVDDFNGVANSTTQRSAYDGIGLARVLPVLNIDQGQTFIMTNGVLSLAAINNSGTIKAGLGTINVIGNVTNSGDLLLSENATLLVSGIFVNNGLLDLINWFGTLPANLVNNGTILDRNSVRVEDLVQKPTGIEVTLPGYAGHTYQLQRSLDLGAPAAWQDIGTAANGTGTHGIGALLALQDPTPPAQRAFYRIAVSASW